MKLLTTLLMFCFSGNVLYSQEGLITIEKDAEIDQLVQVYNTVKKKSSYYQVQVGFRNNATQAKKLLDDVKIDFPKWFSTIEFREPTYRVRVGKFNTRMDAEKGYAEIRKKYPNAMLLKPNTENGGR